jgi:purine catabolism regulator
MLGAAVMVFDARGEPLVQHAFRRPIGTEMLAAIGGEVRARARRREGRPFAPGGEDGHAALALPISSDGTAGRREGVDDGRVPEVWLVVIKDAGPLSDFDRLALHQAVTIVALELLRRRVAGDTERRLAGDILNAAVRGELSGVELARRLEPFGLSERVATVVLERPGGARGASAALEAALSGALRDEAAAGLVASTGSLTCGLLRGMEDEELFALAQRVLARVLAEVGPARLGAGRAVASGDARRSFHEARCALEAVAMGTAADGAVNGAAPRIATYKDLGSFQLLLSLQDEDALRLFCDSILAPIEASEGHYGGELMRSLEAFIEENGQWEKAARRLYCHRHTLRYRIRRVEELTGRDLANARDRIEFWLALRGRELVS